MALSANTSRKLRNHANAIIDNGVILTGAVIYHHALIERTAAGKLQPITNGTTAAFAGLALLHNPTSTGGLTGDGTEKIDFIAGNAEVLMTSINSDVTIGIVNATAIYAADDDAVTADNTLGPVVGVLADIPAAGTAWIRLRGNTLGRAS